VSGSKTGVGIKGYGIFVPRLRIPRAAIAEAHSWALPGLKALGKGERPICSWDEDAITMAVQAARDCLAAATQTASTRSAAAATDAGAASAAVSTKAAPDISDVVLASTTAPFADLQNASIVARALRLKDSVTSQDATGSTRAGLRALAAALESDSALEQRGEQQKLVIAADCRRAKPGSTQELTYGAAAAAWLLGRGDLAAHYLGRHSLEVPFVDHFRESGAKYDYYWEERWIRDEGVTRLAVPAIKGLLEKLGISSERVSWFGLCGAPAGSDKLVAKALGFAAERVLPDLQGTVGDTGAAQSSLLLASALECGKSGDVVVVAAFGLGCEALAFEIGESSFRPVAGLAAAVAKRAESSSYLKMLSFGGELQLDWGPRSETSIKAALTQQYRSSQQLLGFVGGRCTACGQVQFPVLPTCVGCASSDGQTPYPLADEAAKVATVSADWLQYYPAPPLYVGLVQFDAGARLLMEIVDVPLVGIQVGAPLRFAFRLKAHDEIRHYSRYFWKAIPAS
jgi:3-hydroxy-3-methylglutaryl CoA synthase